MMQGVGSMGIRKSKLAEVYKLLAAHDVVCLQDVHSGVEEFMATFFHSLNEWHIFFSGHRQLDAGGVATFVRKKSLAGHTGVSCDTVVDGRILAIHITAGLEFGAQTCEIVNIHNHGLLEHSEALSSDIGARLQHARTDPTLSAVVLIGDFNSAIGDGSAVCALSGSHAQEKQLHVHCPELWHVLTSQAVEIRSDSHNHFNSSSNHFNTLTRCFVSCP